MEELNKKGHTVESKKSIIIRRFFNDYNKKK